MRPSTVLRHLLLAAVLFFARADARAGQPKLIGALASGVNAADVGLLPASSNVCVAAARFGGSRNFQVIRVANPVTPAFVAAIAANDYSGERLSLSADGTRACMTGYFGGMKFIALDNTSAPTVLGTFGTASSRNVDVALKGDKTLAFVADEAAGVLVVSLTNASAPSGEGRYQAPFSNQYSAAGVDLAPDGRLLLVAAQRMGLLVLDVTNAAEPRAVSVFTPPAGSGPFTDAYCSPDGRVAFTVGGSGVGDPAFHIISITNPAAPALLARYTDTQRGQGFSDMALSPDGSTAFLVGNNAGLQAVDVSRGTVIEYLAEFYEVIDDFAPQATGVALSPDGRTAYVAQRGSGLRIVDVSGVYDIDDDGLPNEWEARHFGGIRAGTAGADSDHDGQSNLQEYIGGSDPNDPSSRFGISGVRLAAAPEVTVNGLAGREYRLWGRGSLVTAESWRVVAALAPLSDGTAVLPDTNAPSSRFYRVDARMLGP